MRNLIIFCGCLAFLCVIDAIGVDPIKEFKIEVTHKVECTTKSKLGDVLRIHYTGKLESGKQFDDSYKRGHPFIFTIGEGNVIKGWDQGLLDMCVGEKRRLTIPPELAYGEKGFDGLIPPGETITFDTELLKIGSIRDEL